MSYTFAHIISENPFKNSLFFRVRQKQARRVLACFGFDINLKQDVANKNLHEFSRSVSISKLCLGRTRRPARSPSGERDPQLLLISKGMCQKKYQRWHQSPQRKVTHVHDVIWSVFSRSFCYRTSSGGQRFYKFQADRVDGTIAACSLISRLCKILYLDYSHDGFQCKYTKPHFAPSITICA